jgi:fumarylacetoacetate (FAA) hydrolase
MKLATLKDGSRDGALILVNRELTAAVDATDLAPTLQIALDDWAETKPYLEERYHQLNTGSLDQIFPFDEKNVMAPLPRAYQWVDGSAYVTHVELVRRARGAELPPSFWTDPLMYQGGSDHFLGPKDDILLAEEAWGIDFEAEIAVITNDVPMGTPVDTAGKHIQLLILVNDVSLRNLIPGELAKGFGFFQSKPASSFSPVAITPDELGAAWGDFKVHLPLISSLNGQRFGYPNAGEDMTFSFAQLIAHAAKTRHLMAGTILGSGTVSNRDHRRGSSCIAERRMLEQLDLGQATTPFLRFGDHVRIEMLDPQGDSIFGAIDQVVRCYKPPI